MSLFGDMFMEPGAGKSEPDTLLSAKNVGPCPAAPRLASNLCGIYNQGATCYMNSLLQTMLMTPEFRHALLAFGDEELGALNKVENNNKKARIIPLQLQKLFARLMLLSAQGCYTTELTDSFGWTNNEELQQHDVQELNRILFSAIEDSLVGTSGHSLISDLYEGTIVNQIECAECKTISAREEKFRDLCMTVAGMDSLYDSLVECYINTELLAGNNQYRCEVCSKLANAAKGAKLRKLPPILTFSLLRFSFDFQKMERYKELGKYMFPKTIDMSPFCESADAAECMEYDLYSVVIHKGSTHGGHYRAYIRDIEDLGTWTQPGEEAIQVATDPATGQVDFIEYDTPLELIQALLAKKPPVGVDVDKLCAELVKQTGVSWNKRFKRNHGPITKFLKKYDDTFVYNPASNWVSLKTHSVIVKPLSADAKPNSGGDNKPQTLSTPPAPGQRWFDFNDSRVTCVSEGDLEKQYSGKESAYMLFYRSRSLTSPSQARGNPAYGISSQLLSSIQEENIKLDQDRYDYEVKVNSLHLELHFSAFYTCTNGLLQPRDQGCCFLELDFDRRKPVCDLMVSITQVGGDLVPSSCHLHVIRRLAGGYHLYDNLSQLDADLPVIQSPISNNTKIFVWDGEQVDGYAVEPGTEAEPILLHINSSITHAFPSNMKLLELREHLSSITGVPLSDASISHHQEGKPRELLDQEKDELTLAGLQMKTGDSFSVDDVTKTQDSQVEDVITAGVGTDCMAIRVESRCETAKEDGTWPISHYTLNKNSSLGEVKALVLSQSLLQQDPSECRLRVMDENFGLRLPLPDTLLVEGAGLNEKSHLVLEAGKPPSSSQILLSFACCTATDAKVHEVALELTDTVKKCLSLMCKVAGVKEQCWHLRMTNWCGEATKVLDDLDMTLENCQLRNGDFLLLQEGRLPPKGHLRLFIWLHPSTVPFPDSIKEMCKERSADVTEGLLQLSIHSVPQEDTGTIQDANNSMLSPLYLGDVIISKDSSLTELKINIMALPLMGAFSVPTDDFLRVRVKEKGRLSGILKGGSQTLQRLRLVCDMQLGVQVLDNEEYLSQYNMVLEVCQRLHGQRVYSPPVELVWDVSQGAFPDSLRQAVSSLVNEPVQQLAMAKYFPEKYEWLVITDSVKKTLKHGKGKQKGQSKTNLRHAPYHLKDGDTIGIKDIMVAAGDDFSSYADDVGIERLMNEADEKRKKRLESRQNNVGFDLGGRSTNRRPEVGIKIHVDSFS